MKSRPYPTSLPPAVQAAIAATDQAHDLVFWLDINAVIRHVNASACRRMCYEQKELISKSFLDFCSDLGRDRWHRLWQRLQQDGGHRLDFTLDTMCERSFPARASFSLVTGDGKKFACCLIPGTAGTAYDRQLEEAQREAREYERLLSFSHFTIERAVDAVFWIDKSARLHRVNQTACVRLGYSREELETMKLYDINPEFSEREWREIWPKIKRHKVLTFESRHRTRDGRILPVEINTNYMEFDGKEFACAFARDISERKRAEQELREAMATVEKLKNRLQVENTYLREEIRKSDAATDIIGKDEHLGMTLKRAEQVAATDATVLILGETGTGKELLARSIHSLSHRHDRPLIKVNCAALARSLIESELFGHEKGAFTGAVKTKAGRFELADGGTIFLDEVGDLDHDLQAKLLRVLQESEFERVGGARTIKVDVRVIAATNRNLEQEIRQGRFREDLYYRLNVFPLQMPPLRNRPRDIELLVNHFIKKHSARLGKPALTLTSAMLKRLKAYSWPGNVRELENVVERALILGDYNTLIVDELPQKPPPNASSGNGSSNLHDVERSHIESVLRDCNWVIEGHDGAAQKLGLKPTTLRDRMKRLGISRPDLNPS